ncbi:MAG TPA: outer membrane beta-barrel protein [Allosphingosinicella sp.]
MSSGAAASLLVMASAANAQDAPPADPPAPVSTPVEAPGVAGRTVYQVDFFRTYSPANALDIVRRVPGFTLDSGSQDVRGFGGAAGNVVINGARPTSKNDTLETILARIPAQRVLRVEVGSGEQFGAEFAGRAQVLNLVLSAAGGLAGNVEAEIRRDVSGQVTPQGSASLLLRRGPSTFNLSVGFNNRHTLEEGTDTLTALPSGALLEFRRKVNEYADQLGFISGSWALDEGENRSAHLNGRFAIGDFFLTQTNDVFPVGGTIRDDRLAQDFRRYEYEIGGDITRPFLGGGVRLVGLATRRTRENVETSLNRIQGNVIGGFEQTVDDVRDERVLRLVWSRNVPNGWTVETGLEGAFNRLDSDVQLFAIGSGGARTRIDLPSDEAVVEEYRMEGFFNAGRSLSPNLRFDAGLTFEASRLTVSGDADEQRVLRFLKPRLVIDWRPGDGWRTQLSIQRTVAQLDFVDFISAAELTNDRVTGGNPDLVPQRAWEFLATIERPILGDGQARLEFGYQAIQQVQDRVPTPEGLDAPGNLGSGRHAFIRGTLDAPLGRFGIRGGRLTVNGTIRDTSVEDPYTHRRRAFSNFQEWQLQATFRQDLERFAWGINYFGSPALPFYRRNEIDVPNGMEPFVNIFGEYRMNRRTTFTLTLENLFEVGGTRGRTFFAPDRSNPNPFLFEFRERNPHRAVALRVRHSFG